MVTFNNAYDEQLTLTDEQEKCLNYHLGDKTLMIKGYAGAGKSLVLQTTALKYINMWPEGKRDHKIAVFTYTNALTTTTRELLDANAGGKDIYTSTLDSYLMDVYKAMGGTYKKMYGGEIRLDNIKQALDEHEKRFGHHRFHELPTKFWEDEIDWMKGMNVSEDDIEYYLNIPRRGRGSSVRMSALDRKTAFEIFVSYCEVNKKKGCGDWSDFALFINQKLKQYTIAKSRGENVAYPIPANLLFEMILIDEAQDLSLAQMLAAMGLYSKAMIVAMDAHQRIYAANWSAKQIGIETQTQWLKKSMRNTIEIDALAESLRSRNNRFIGNEENEKRAIPVRTGEKPVICALKDSSEEKTFVINQLKTWLKESGNIRIGLIAATKAQVEKYSAWCADAGIDHEKIKKKSTFSMKTPGVKILNAHNAKGLEFFYVLIPEFIEGKFPYSLKDFEDPDEIEIFLSQCRSLAYVAMTRAQEKLILTYSGKKPSRFISEMDPALYTKIGNVTINPIPIDDDDTIDPPPVRNADTASDLLSFFQSKGFECVDKRSKTGGSLWIVGSRSDLAPLVREAKKIFGDLGNDNYSEHGGRATGHRAAWYITANK